MTALDTTVDRVRQPEYIGENRCLPCTVVNSIIALVLAGAIGLLWPPAGLGVLPVFAAAIYLRGYLVPGTPELTTRYFPDRLLRVFGKEPVVTSTPTNDSAMAAEVAAADAGKAEYDDGDIEELLLSTGVVENCTDEDDLCLTSSFRDVWWRRMHRFRDDHDAAKAHLGAILEIDPAAIDFEDNGRFLVTYGGDGIGRWDSNAAFYADLAVEPTLKEWLPDWEGLGDRRRTELIAGMRAFLETCPACEAALEPVEDVRKSCCSSKVVGVNVDCLDCGARVFSGRYQ